MADTESFVWLIPIRDSAGMDRFRIKNLGEGVKVTVARMEKTKQWVIQLLMFEKTRFKSKAQMQTWLKKHLQPGFSAHIINILDSLELN